MKKYYLVIILLISTISFYFILNKPTQHKETLNNINTKITKEREREQLNTVSYGLKDIDGKHIDNGSVIEMKNNKVNVYLSINHNIDENREYGLIILENYKQKSFKVEKNIQETSKYFFDMNPYSSKKIKISLNASKSAHELTFLLIKKPNYKLRDNDINKASILEEILSMRYAIKNQNKIDIPEEIQPESILKDGFNEPLFITKSKENLQIIFSETEENELMISNGNETDEEMKYIILAFKDWEQNEIVSNKDIIYTTVEPHTRQIFKFTLPKVEQESNFQLIALPFPNEVSKDNYVSQQAYGSFRMLIQNKP
ncbi:hypothetical protein BK742_17160 [Bacillus thuringiensis serovar pingluonsis]|uniref:Uncharacterized protein n=1 Tax=Bacillus thuringiensis serovar pingluonsis TaxID=180881 RepID=A0A243BC47_BACTU|nr:MULTISPECIES: hypothetical protein [Bacillus cereus group]MEB9686125.1 hypothetical protein [Bacillus anthracis]OTY42314.1 hypothetical protein BK742_17160 [Bacillus thuringiensis serovar pingluonsis]